DVGLEDAPPEDASCRVPHRQTLHMEPSIDAVGAALAELDVVRLPGFERPAPYGNDARKVIRVNGVRARPVFQFFERLAKVVEDLTVDEFHGSVRRQDCNEGGNPVDDLMKCELVLQ